MSILHLTQPMLVRSLLPCRADRVEIVLCEVACRKHVDVFAHVVGTCGTENCDIDTLDTQRETQGRGKRDRGTTFQKVVVECLQTLPVGIGVVALV